MSFPSATPALRRYRWEDWEFEARLNYTVRHYLPKKSDFNKYYVCQDQVLVCSTITQEILPTVDKLRNY